MRCWPGDPTTMREDPGRRRSKARATACSSATSRRPTRSSIASTPRREEVGRYAIYTMRTGRIIRVPAARLWPRLPPAEEEQARYFIQRMNDELPGAVAGVVSRGQRDR